MSREVLPKVKDIIASAMKEAESFDDVKLRPEHIVLSILIDNDNDCVLTLKKLNIDTILLYDKIGDFLRKTDLTPRLTSTKKRKIPFSDETKSIFKEVETECEKLNDKVIDTPHLMLAILISKSPISDMLVKNGVAYPTFLKVMNTIRKNSEEPTNNGLSSDDDSANGDQFIRKSKSGDTKTKTPGLDNFCRDISKAAENGEFDPVIGRIDEIQRVSQILSRRKKNNPVLIGEPGVGKTSIIEGLAQLIKDGSAPRTLIGKRLLALDLPSIIAGTKYRGQFEERMKLILTECKSNPDVILFIDELHTIIGAGNASGSLDASNIFKPALARGELQVIGATTLDEYRENIEKDGALTRRFQQILVNEPTLAETKVILMNIKGHYEKHHRVKYTEEAIDECVKLSARYIMDRAMPDKAIDVLDEAGSKTNVSVEKPIEIVELIAKLNEIIEEKKLVVKSQKYEEAAKLRDEEKKTEKAIEAAMEEWNNQLDEKETIVGVEIISEVVSKMTGIPLTKISTQESKKLVNMDKELIGKVIGQDAAVAKVVKAIKRNRIGIKDKNKPVGSFIFLGPTGVGKTLLAKLLAEHIFGDSDALIRMDMSEYMEKFSVSRLIGPPPGYVGYDQGGQLTEKVRRKPHCVILFDEIEKAHEDVFNLLLQLLDEGQLTDGLGRKVNFKNALIIMTSNIGVNEIQSFGKGMGLIGSATTLDDENRNRELIEKALKKKFKPEFLNRIDEAIVFNKLTSEHIGDIIYLEVKKLEERIAEIGYKLNIDTESVEFLCKHGYDEEYGARPLTRAIQHYVEDMVADEILNETIKEGETINVIYDKEKDTLVIKQPKKSKK